MCHLVKCLLLLPFGIFYLYNSTIETINHYEHTYTLNDKQDAVLVQMLSYFNDLGVGGDMNQDDFDSLLDLVCNSGSDVVKPDPKFQ